MRNAKCEMCREHGVWTAAGRVSSSSNACFSFTHNVRLRLSRDTACVAAGALQVVTKHGSVPIILLAWSQRSITSSRESKGHRSPRLDGDSPKEVVRGAV